MYKIIITTTDSLKTADKIKITILNKKLSPCIQLISNVHSEYIWKNKVHWNNITY